MRTYLTADVARTNALLGEIDDRLPNEIGQWTSVDEDAAELIDAAMSYVQVERSRRQRVDQQLRL